MAEIQDINHIYAVVKVVRTSQNLGVSDDFDGLTLLAISSAQFLDKKHNGHHCCDQDDYTDGHSYNP
jgi:hypothetical protein